MVDEYVVLQILDPKVEDKLFLGRGGASEVQDPGCSSDDSAGTGSA